MSKTIRILTAVWLFIALVYCVALGTNSVHADRFIPENPTNKFPMVYEQSIIADNYYRNNGNYDISYDGKTCFRWASQTHPVVIENPKIITYQIPIDDFDEINIISCESSLSGYLELIASAYLDLTIT